MFYQKSGWMRPARYELSSTSEHLRCREDGGIFDVHSMGKVVVRGRAAGALLHLTCTNNIASLDIGSACYTCMCADDGGILDDLIVYRTGASEFYLITNTFSRERVVSHLSALSHPGTVVEDVTSSLAYIAVQGPASRKVLVTAGMGCDLSSEGLPYFGCTVTDLVGVRVLLARTGYTGELGYELNFPAEFAVDVWERLCEVGLPFGVQPCGGEALMSLRLEKGYRSYGSDIDTTVTPIEAGLGWTVAWEKPEFCGREALLRARKEVPSRHAVCVLGLDGAEFSQATKLFNEREEIVGEITSGLYGPSLAAYVGLAYVERGVSSDARLFVGGVGGVGMVACSRRPFFDPLGERIRV